MTRSQASPWKPIILITGAGSGLGESLAKEYALQGARLALSDLRREAAERVAREITENGGEALASAVDVTKPHELQLWIEDCLARLGPIDVFINNAGIGSVGLIERFSETDWTRLIDVNVRGVANGIQAIYPVFIRQGHGHIVNIASGAGLSPVPGLGIYSATKHFVVGLSKALRTEALRHGISVSVVCPGAVKTPLLTSEVKSVAPVTNEAILRWWARLLPITPEAFARAAVRKIAKKKAVIIVPGFLRPILSLNRLFPSFERAYHRWDLKRSLELLPELEKRN